MMHKCVIATLIVGIAAASGIAGAAENQPIALDLKSALQLTLTTSPQIASAGASAEMSQGEVNKAKSALYPNVGLESGYSYLSKETMFGATPVWEHSTVVNRVAVQQTIFSGGQVQATINRAQQSFLAAQHGRRAAQADVVTNVGTAYFRARQSQEIIGVVEASIKSLEASFDAATKLHEGGVVTNSDVLRAQVALTSAKENLISATNGYNVSLAALRSSIGLTQDTQITLASDAADNVPDAGLQTSPALRPEIAAGDANVQAAVAGMKAAKASRLPTVAIAADYFNQPTGSQFPRLSNTLLAGIIVKFNAFDGGLTRASINQSDAAAKKAKQDLEIEKRRVEFEQQAASLDLNSAQAKVVATASQLQSAEDSLRVLQAGYKEGLTPLTDVLSSEAALTGARVSRLAALYEVKIAQLNFIRANGQTDILTR